METSPVRIVLCAFPSACKARQIGTALIEKQLAACVNVIPVVESVFRWEGAVTEEQEALAIFKTTQERLPEFQKDLVEAHPYDVPEVLVVPVVGGNASYLAWVERETQRGEG